MPARAKPRELRRYFSDLEYHFTRSSVADSTEKKKHATRFLDVDDQEVWEALEEFKPAHSYNDFKAAVLKLYPGNDSDRRYSLADLDSLVGQYARVGILSKGDYSEFYRQFLVITKYLIGRQRLSLTEQSGAFRRAIAPPSLWERVERRLQVKKPDVHPEDPYDIADLNEAVEFALATTSSSPVSTAASQMSSSSQSQSEIKQEPISALLESMNGLIKVLMAQQQIQQSRSSGSQSSNSFPPRSDQNCSYCSETGHFIAKCLHVDEDMNAGKCKHDSDGRVTLPSGAFVPRRIEGRNLRARIEEWHRQNPGQLAAAQLMLELATHHLSEPPSTASTVPPTANTFQLSEEEQICSLEREIYALRTRAQARRAIAAGEPVETPEQPVRATSPPAAAPNPAPSPPGILRSPHVPSTPSIPAPEHPFAKARDAAYAPPRDRNVGALPKPAQPKKPNPAYRTNAPVYDEKIANAVFDRSMDTPVTLTQRELLSLSPEVRAQVCEATTSRRVAPASKDKSAAPPVEQLAVDALPYDANIFHNSLDEQRSKDARNTAFYDSMPATFAHIAQPALPSNAFIVPDPYECFYNCGEIPDDLVVSMESSAIRSILPTVDNRQVVESIVDGGSQIVAMSEAVCHELSLPYDPRIVLKMQFANSSVSPSLGLARNVPFTIGDITLYLQVHVVRNPAYDILLGRPFDVLTQSVARNLADENQTITICDPNTGKVTTVPTVPRGPPRPRPQNFQHSRI
ncbi:hypothetical protein DFH08DRAFT_925334 [Mycena albidolilacea]|uniref:DUF4100 domain-containing protein n=1 Tax=Mycena albidolilacea TaxID=1033008 RepID=A0AAD6ZVP6_9AGAR|nr:hypothetical protein DFH08DRAFT_925334 [Mycena albidolilacea]